MVEVEGVARVVDVDEPLARSTVEGVGTYEERNSCRRLVVVSQLIQRC